MRAVFIASRSYTGLGTTGGAETMAHDLMRSLVLAGWDCEGIALGGPTPVVDVDGVKARRVRGGLYWPSDVFDGTDLILTHLGMIPEARRLGKKYGIPVVQLVHNTNKFSVGFLGSGCDYAIYNAEWVRDYHEGARKSKLIRVRESETHSSLQKRLESAWPYMVVRPPAIAAPEASTGSRITLINLVPNKGPEIFYGLAELHPELEFMGVIGGYEPEQHVIRDLPNVTIHPHVSDMRSVYDQTRLLLVPSRYESYGRVAVEAMARGIPVLASDGEGLRECLGNGGRLVPGRDLELWDSELLAMLAGMQEHQDFSRSRYLELQDQTRSDLELFCSEMEALVNKHHGGAP